jgi:hypothetical protein
VGLLCPLGVARPLCWKEPDIMSIQGSRPSSKEGLARAFVQRLLMLSGEWGTGKESGEAKVEMVRRAKRRSVIRFVDSIIVVQLVWLVMVGPIGFRVCETS